MSEGHTGEEQMISPRRWLPTLCISQASHPAWLLSEACLLPIGVGEFGQGHLLALAATGGHWKTSSLGRGNSGASPFLGHLSLL